MQRLAALILAIITSAAAVHARDQAAPPASAGAAEPRVAWRPFDEAAMREAAESGRLILLYVSAWWDYHDRIMSEITYADPAVVELIRSSYIPVRVDTDRRPDLFARYGMGAWPTTAVILPDGHPMYYPDRDGKTMRAGGAFYSPESFRTYFSRLAEYYAANSKSASDLAHAADEAILAHRNADRAEVTIDTVEAIVGKLLDAYRERPAVAQPVDRHPDFAMAGLALDYWSRKPERRVLDVGLNYLTDMARGGIYDRLGGGFFRYAHDTRFILPSFEKVPAVNAEAIQTYLSAYEVTGNGVFLRFAESTLDHVTKHGLDGAGTSFTGAMAAWSRTGDNGEYYTWLEDEVRAALTEEEFALAAAAWDIRPRGETEDTAPLRNVIYMAEGPRLLAGRVGGDEKKAEALLESARLKLLAVREKRPRPPVDPFTYGDSSAMMISAFLSAGRTLHRPDHTRRALEALDILLARCRDERGLIAHACRPETGEAGGESFLSDQAYVIAALVDAHEEAGSARYLNEARGIAERAVSVFREPLSGGFTDRPPDPNAFGLLAWPVRDLGDGAAMATALLRLHHLTGEPSYRNVAKKATESWADEIGSIGAHAAPLGRACLRLIQEPLEILVAGDASDPALAKGRERALSLHHPWRLIRHFTAGEGAAELTKRGLKPISGAQVAFCLGKECAGPFPAAEPLRARLDGFLNRGASSEKGKGARGGGL